MNIGTEYSMYKLRLTDQAKLDRAASKIAPNWPLDRSIAVNPLWQMRDDPIENIAAQLASKAKISYLMPLDYYLGLFEKKKISVSSLQEAARRRGLDMENSRLISFLSTSSPSPQSFQSIAMLVDTQRSNSLISWQDELIFQMSQFCASFFQKMRDYSESTPASLFQEWLRVVRMDRGLEVLTGEPRLQSLFKMLPDDLDTLLALSISELKLDGDFIESYAHALLLEINGWASWIAYLDVQNPENAKGQRNLREILGIRMAWELVIWLLYKDRGEMRLEDLWQNQMRLLPRLENIWKKAQFPLWIWSSALEIEYQTQLHEKLIHAQPFLQKEAYLQAVFCIDVRSEPVRRALEFQDQSIQTFGFAGFFGLPLSFEPSNLQISRPQVPGLLKPIFSAVERDPDVMSRRFARRKVSWDNWTKAAPSSFFMVEATGWGYLGRLLKRSFFASPSRHPVNQLSQRKKWIVQKDGCELSSEEKAKIAGHFLRNSGLNNPSPWVLLIGHGSQSCNNPQAASLDCGACGGQTGEVNVRVLADLLNDPEVRAQLLSEGFIIKPSTRFLAGLHNTSSDDLDLFDEDMDPVIDKWLKASTVLAQRERIGSLAPECSSDAKSIAKEMKRRGSDWSEIRPEWGLAGNAAFIVAPRTWTRSLDLGGRCFLHDYDWSRDSESSLLEMILTAPMVVTHWINMQYNCSVADNDKYGSGNKVLHNVVGGNIAVFEGSGGDLRFGLAMQSLHDGEDWRHVPQRLSVYIAAPAQAITKILSKHETIRALVQNEWLYLFHWDETGISRIGPQITSRELGT